MIEIIPLCDVNTAVAHERAVREFRPTAVVLARVSGEYVLTSSMKAQDLGIWWPVQGGIDDDTISVGAARELREEINLEACPDRITVFDAVRYPNASLRDGYTQGKLLIGCFVDCDVTNARCGDIRPNGTEIAELQYVSEQQAREIMFANAQIKPSSAIKAEFILHLLDSVPK